MFGRRVFLSLLGALAISACEAEQSDYRPAFASGGERAEREYTFAVHPLHNPQLLDRMYQPLVEHVNARLSGARLRFVASRDYEAYGRRLGAGEFDFALPNPLQTVEAGPKGYRVFGKMADDDRFRGIILVRKDSGVAAVEDLKGKTISYPAPTALAGTMLPQLFLQKQGLRVADETTTRYVGSQESSIMSVYLKTSAAGATWPVPWDVYVREHPAEAAMLEVRWRTEPLVNNSLMVHRSVPADVAAQVAEILLSLHESEEGRLLLQQIGLSRFEPADETTYRPVADFLKAFEQTFGARRGVAETQR